MGAGITSRFILSEGIRGVRLLASRSRPAGQPRPGAEDRREGRRAPLRLDLRHRPRRAARPRWRARSTRTRRPASCRAAPPRTTSSRSPCSAAWRASTTRARLGTSVLVIPYRNPLVTAKMLATIDRLSGGRVILGAGVGWLREEFEALGAPPFEERGAVTDEYLQAHARGVDDRSRDLRGPLLHACATSTCCPSPCSPAASRSGSAATPTPRCGAPATLGDGWHPIAHAAARRCCCPTSTRPSARSRSTRGRARPDAIPKSITLTLRVPMEVRAGGAKAAGRRPAARSRARPTRSLADIRALRGARRHALRLRLHAVQDLRAVLANMERFAHDVRPKASAEAARTVPGQEARTRRATRRSPSRPRRRRARARRKRR